MKKLISVSIFAFIFILSACGQEQPRPPVVKKLDPKKVIIGRWKAVKLGRLMKRMHIELPASLTFSKDGKYIQTFSEMGGLLELTGNYKITNGTKLKIDLFQLEPRKATLIGLFKVVNKNKILIILYNQRISARPSSLDSEDTQEYERDGETPTDIYVTPPSNPNN